MPAHHFVVPNNGCYGGVGDTLYSYPEGQYSYPEGQYSYSERQYSYAERKYSYPTQRLYPATPGREFVCVTSYRPQRDGDLMLKKGQFVEGCRCC